MFIPKWIKEIPQEQPILLAGPTASGKSALASVIAETAGGRVINADALQVFKNWRILTARPSITEEIRIQHSLYGHIESCTSYSVGHWLREIVPILKTKKRPIIVGGTGLYFKALTEGLANIPEIPFEIIKESEKKQKMRGLRSLICDLDSRTKNLIDIQNPRRVLRAWQVWAYTGRSILEWQHDTPTPILPLKACTPILLTLDKYCLSQRIERRFKKMIECGVLEEAKINAKNWCPNAPSSKAIGAQELVSFTKGNISLDDATQQITKATKKLAKRQRTWFRSNMKEWVKFEPKNF